MVSYEEQKLGILLADCSGLRDLPMKDHFALGRETSSKTVESVSLVTSAACRVGEID